METPLKPIFHSKQLIFVRFPQRPPLVWFWPILPRPRPNFICFCLICVQIPGGESSWWRTVRVRLRVPLWRSPSSIICISLTTLTTYSKRFALKLCHNTHRIHTYHTGFGIIMVATTSVRIWATVVGVWMMYLFQQFWFSPWIIDVDSVLLSCNRNRLHFVFSKWVKWVKWRGQKFFGVKNSARLILANLIIPFYCPTSEFCMSLPPFWI